MFRGAVPPDMRRILNEATADWSGENVAIGCSGNFTIERSIYGRVAAMSGNDVTIFTSTIGRYLAGYPINMDVRLPEFDWMNEWMTTPVDIAATVMLTVPAYGGGSLTNPARYYERIRHQYRSQWRELHAKTVERLEGLPFRLASFHCGDVREFVDDVGDAPIVTFPPFFAGDYESQYKNLDAIFDWDSPTFPPLDEDGVQQLVADVMDRPRWIIGLPVRPPEFEPHLRGLTQTTSRGKQIFVYASDIPVRVATPRNLGVTPRWPIMQPDEELTGTIRIAQLHPDEFQHVRSMFMAKSIVPSDAPIGSWAVLDGEPGAERIIGVYATGIGSSRFMERRSPLDPSAFLLSDMSVTSTRYARLSKLVLYAALSHESHVRFEQLYGRAVRSLMTAAFSDKHVSSKYRGMWHLLGRTEDPKGDSHRFRLDYWSELPRWTLKEGVAEWFARHSMGRR